MDWNYYIFDNGYSTDKQDLNSGVHISKFPSHFNEVFPQANGPYKSLRALKRNSPIYLNLKKTNLRRAQQIIKDRHIKVVEKLMLFPRGTEFKMESVEAFTHATQGRIKNGDVTGVHFYDPKRVKIIEEIEFNEETGVFKARFEFLNLRNNKWIEKRVSSTFFPKDWNQAILLMECKYAYEKIVDFKPINGKIESSTSSGIKVELVFKKDKLKSLYPLI